jgi:glycosyltransferase involved in cell wall biosynthesis
MDAPEISAASDIVVLPTTKREGLSRAILEGMAYGRPAIVTATGGNAELVVDGVTGLVVPPNDPESLGRALHQLATDAPLRERYGRAARQRVIEQFSVQQGVDKTLAVYESLLQ